MNKTVETVIKFSPLVFAILTVLGYIYLQSFYYFFEIELINHLELSEIPLLFYNKSIIIVASLFSIFLISYYFNDKLDENQKDLDEKINIEKDPNEKLKILKKDRDESTISFNKKKKAFGITLLILLSLYILSNLITGNYIRLLYPIGYIIFAIIMLIAENRILKILINKSNVFSTFSIYGSFILLVLFNLSIITGSIEKGYNIRYGNSVSKQISFDYNNGEIKTSKSIVYLGETRNDLFMFDRMNSKTYIYKKKKIENYIIKLNDSKNDTIIQLSIDKTKSIDSIKIKK